MKLWTSFSVLAFTLAFSATVAFAAPSITARQAEHSFGTIAQGEKVDHVFTFHNSGDAPLNVVKVSSSCGCTVANVSTRTLQPGQSAEIKATFNSANFRGPVSKTITVETNDPAKPVTTFILKGTIEEELMVNPPQLSLGAVKAGKSTEATVTIENKSRHTVKLISVSSPMPQLKATLSKQSLKPGESAKIMLSLTPRPDDRFLSGYLTVKTSHPHKPELMIAVYGSVSR